VGKSEIKRKSSQTNNGGIKEAGEGRKEIKNILNRVGQAVEGGDKGVDAKNTTYAGTQTHTTQTKQTQSHPRNKEKPAPTLRRDGEFKKSSKTGH